MLFFTSGWRPNGLDSPVDILCWMTESWKHILHRLMRKRPTPERNRQTSTCSKMHAKHNIQHCGEILLRDSHCSKGWSVVLNSRQWRRMVRRLELPSLMKSSVTASCAFVTAIIILFRSRSSFIFAITQSFSHTSITKTSCQKFNTSQSAPVVTSGLSTRKGGCSIFVSHPKKQLLSRDKLALSDVQLKNGNFPLPLSAISIRNNVNCFKQNILTYFSLRKTARKSLVCYLATYIYTNDFLAVFLREKYVRMFCLKQLTLLRILIADNGSGKFPFFNWTSDNASLSRDNNCFFG